MKDFNTVHRAITDMYDLKTLYKGQKQNIEKWTNRRFIKAFNGKEWESLNEIEKTKFVCIDIREDLLEKYIDPSYHKRIRGKIDNYIGDTFTEMNLFNARNKAMANMHKVYYEKNATEQEQKSNFNHFVKNLHLINDKIPIPTFEEWIEQNEKTPRRIYDYYMDFVHQPYNKPNNPDEEPVTQQEIDHVILETLMKVIEKQNGVRIDTEKIKSCLYFLKNYNIDDTEPLQLSYEPDSPLSREQQDKIIENNKTYINYFTMRNHLDFYESQR